MGNRWAVLFPHTGCPRGCPPVWPQARCPRRERPATGLQLWATLHVIPCHLKTSSNSVIQKLRFFLPLMEGHELSNHGPYASCARSSSVAASFMAGGAALRATSEILSVPLATRLVVGASPTHQPCGRTCVPLLFVPIRWCPPHSRESLRGRASVAGSLARRPQGSAPGCRDPKKVGAPRLRSSDLGPTFLASHQPFPGPVRRSACKQSDHLTGGAAPSSITP